MISLCINERDYQYEGDERRPLSDVLRNDFNLTGTKVVCQEGFCGSCLIYINNIPVLSCLKPVGLASGSKITTIEGVGNIDSLNVVQQAFEELDVVQCGMCFPGMVMKLTHFLHENKKPDRKDIKDALIGNLCRCTGYERIIDAVIYAAEKGICKDEK